MVANIIKLRTSNFQCEPTKSGHKNIAFLKKGAIGSLAPSVIGLASTSKWSCWEEVQDGGSEKMISIWPCNGRIYSICHGTQMGCEDGSGGLKLFWLKRERRVDEGEQPVPQKEEALEVWQSRTDFKFERQPHSGSSNLAPQKNGDYLSNEESESVISLLKSH